MFLDEIKSSIGESFGCGFKATLFGNGSVYISGVKAVKSFSFEEVVLIVKKGDFVIKGKNLEIKKICEGDVCVCGKISSLSEE